MVFLRGTKRVLRYLPEPSDTSGQADTGLGDWYANRLVVGRKPLLLLVSSTSLLPILAPARDVRSLPDRLADLVSVRLKRLGVAERLVIQEICAMDPVQIAPTCDRTVLGIMVEFSRIVPHYLREDGWDEDSLAQVEAKLAETPCRASRRLDEVVFPCLAAPKILAAHWS
jgi:hypothetical protein